MAVDVLTETLINRACAEIAACAANPSNAPKWYINIESVDWKTAPPLKSRLADGLRRRFLGRRPAHTYEVVDLVPGKRLVMRTAEGPFPMETTYTWEPAGGDVTRMTLRNRGEPRGFARFGAPMMAAAMTRANRKDLVHLRALLGARLWARSTASQVSGAQRQSRSHAAPVVDRTYISRVTKGPAL